MEYYAKKSQLFVNYYTQALDKKSIEDIDKYSLHLYNAPTLRENNIDSLISKSKEGQNHDFRSVEK